jgi:predicted metal-dependent phosphoesterase TrpH
MIFKAEGFVHTDKPAHYVNETSFNLDKDLSCLKFKFFGEGKELFFHVKDPKGILRVQHQSSLKPSTVLLHKDEIKTGIGTCPGKIEKGKWKLKVFTYGPRFNRMWGEVPFEVKVFEGLENSEIQSDNYVSWVDSNEIGKGEVVLKEFEPENIDSPDEKWLSGDFHVHSILSDGYANPSELLDEGLSKNLDFFFISDHNILTTGFPERRGITVFPSYEVTTKIGHFNAAGLRYVPEWILSKGPEPSWNDLEKLIKDFKVNGALISINHPFFVPWQWQYDDLTISWVDSLEIVTAPYYKNIRDINEKALSMLDLMWNNGYRITGIGGSDTHTKFQLGQPVTKVYAKPGSLSSMLDGVKKHRAEIFVDLKCDFSYITEGNSLLPGTDIRNFDDVPLEFSFSLDRESDPVFLRVVENGNIVEENKALPGEKCVIERIWKGNSDWIRCEIRDHNNRIRGYINPLHRGKKERTIKKWGDAVDFLSR